MVPLLVGLTAGQAVWIFMWSFGLGTNCTNRYDCGTGGCSECRIIDLAAIGAGLLTLILAVALLFVRWPRRGRRAMLIATSAVIAVLGPLVASTWSLST